MKPPPYCKEEGACEEKREKNSRRDQGCRRRGRRPEKISGRVRGSYGASRCPTPTNTCYLFALRQLRITLSSTSDYLVIVSSPYPELFL